jgi:hypothetical protein
MKKSLELLYSKQLLISVPNIITVPRRPTSPRTSYYPATNFGEHGIGVETGRMERHAQPGYLYFAHQ